jgi:hypothetical protein
MPKVFQEKDMDFIIASEFSIPRYVEKVLDEFNKFN